MKKQFLIDVDGVALHWNPAFEKYIKHTRGIVLDQHPEQFYQVEKVLNISHEEANKLIIDFHKSEYFKHLPPFRDAMTYIPKMHSEGWDFIAITAAGVNNQIKKNRIHNLKTHFGDAISDVILADPDTTKLHKLQQFKSSFWIDDSPRHVFAGIEAGHTSFFMYREHKAKEILHHPDVITVHNWKELYEWINGHFKGD